MRLIKFAALMVAVPIGLVIMAALAAVSLFSIYMHLCWEMSGDGAGKLTVPELIAKARGKK